MTCRSDLGPASHQSPLGPEALTKELTARMRTIDVLVAGGGPVGLMMACELRRHGVSCRIIDPLPEPTNQCKAIGVQPRTLEIWDDMGIVADAIDAGLWLRGMRGYVNGKQTVELFLELPDMPYGFLALPQYETERILTAQLNRFDVVVERKAALKAFHQHDNEVIVEVTRPQGPPEELRCRYLVGCDGAHSTVRHRLGLPFDGDRYAEQYMLGDVEVHWDLPHGWSYRFLHMTDGKIDDLLVCIPIPGKSRYRLSMLASPELLVEQPPGIDHGLPSNGPKPTVGHIQAVVDRLAPAGTEVDRLRWSSVFGVSHRIVPRYGAGRVFLAGDAAHIHPPTGAQGMNTGIQDAYNLAWKLALVIKGAAHPGLLESYDAERRPVGEDVVGRTHRRAEEQRRGQVDTGRDQLMKDAQLLVNYRDSAGVAENWMTGDAGRTPPCAGDRAPDVLGLRREGVGFPLRLFDVLRGTQYVLLLYVDSGEPNLIAVGAEVGASVQARYGKLIRSYMIVAQAVRPWTIHGLPVLRDTDEQFRRVYPGTPSSVYIIRPDGYIAYRCAPVRSDCVIKYLERILS
jgi:2-polyprenyl-6-methoxyphenol hydroxylase-like FAD-dependent oxidoreductase